MFENWALSHDRDRRYGIMTTKMLKCSIVFSKEHDAC